MKVLFALILIAGFGYWMTKEIQHEQELQSELDEAKKQIEAYQHVVHQQALATPPSGIKANQQWMWGTDPNNPLNAPPVHARANGR